MANHLDVPGMGILGGSDFSNGDMVLSALEEADAKDAQFDAEQSGGPVPTVAVQTPRSGVPLSAQAAAVPDPTGMPTTSTSGPLPPGGRPPGYAVGTQHGSASKGAMSLLASLGVAAGAGAYFKDPKAAAAGFLVTGSALNLLNGQSASQDPNPSVAQEGTWSTVAAAVGLGLGGYLAYSVYKGSK